MAHRNDVPSATSLGAMAPHSRAMGSCSVVAAPAGEEVASRGEATLGPTALSPSRGRVGRDRTQHRPLCCGVLAALSLSATASLSCPTGTRVLTSPPHPVAPAPAAMHVGVVPNRGHTTWDRTRRGATSIGRHALESQPPPVAL